jgi:hypothetical protein
MEAHHSRQPVHSDGSSVYGSWASIRLMKQKVGRSRGWEASHRESNRSTQGLIPPTGKSGSGRRRRITASPRERVAGTRVAMVFRVRPNRSLRRGAVDPDGGTPGIVPSAHRGPPRCRCTCSHHSPHAALSKPATRPYSGPMMGFAERESVE